MEEKYKYYAFISYNSADEKWAKWLQHNLEYYHIPSALCKEYPELPPPKKKIRPVFWYKQDLSGTKLKEALSKELCSSKYLIVVCSPDSAKSDWVNDEVDSFIKQGKGDKIIPFIVAGNPHAGKYSVIGERLNRANINRYCFELDENGFNKKITYHSSSSGNIDESNCGNNNGAYGYIITRDSLRRITSLSVLKSSGLLGVDKSNVHVVRYEYSKWGIQSISSYDLNGNHILCEQLGYAHKVAYVYDDYGNVIESIWYGVDEKITNSMFGYASQTKEYENGCVVESVNYDKNGDRAINIQQMCSKVCSVYDSKGRLVKWICYDENDKICPNKDGVAITEYEYDSDGNLIKRANFDENGELTFSKLTGYSILLQEYNSNGQVVLSTCIGINGEKVINKGGFCVQKTSYNRLGQPCKFELYDENDNLVVSKDGFAVQKIDLVNDRKGNTIYTYSIYDENLEPVYNKQSLSHKIEYMINDLGQCVEELYYDIYGELCENGLGFARCKYTYDQKNRLLTRTFYDKNQRYVRLYNRVNYSDKINNIYETDNNIVGGFVKDSIVYLLDNKQLVYRINENGQVDDSYFCSAIELREIRENTLVNINYDKKNNKIVNDDGYAIRVVIYDDLYRPIDILYFDEDSVRCNTKVGVSRMSNEYDKNGNRIKCCFYDKYERLVNVDNAGAIICWEYDNRNNEVKRFCLDEEEKPLMNTLKGFGLLQKYDNKDRVVEKVCIDTANNPYLMPNMNYSIQRMEYDDKGNIIEESYYDNERSVNCYRGFHVAEYMYDDNGNPKEVRYYDSERKKISVEGSHWVKNKYDHKGLVMSEYYDLYDKYLGKLEYFYDIHDNIDYVIRYDKYYRLPQEYRRLAIYENEGEDIYVIVKWEHWDISQPLNNYLQTLMERRRFQQNNVVVYNYIDNTYEYKIVDMNSNINMISIPDIIYRNLVHYAKKCMSYEVCEF